MGSYGIRYISHNLSHSSHHFQMFSHHFSICGLTMGLVFSSCGFTCAKLVAASLCLPVAMLYLPHGATPCGHCGRRRWKKGWDGWEKAGSFGFKKSKWTKQRCRSASNNVLNMGIEYNRMRILVYIAVPNSITQKTRITWGWVLRDICPSMAAGDSKQTHQVAQGPWQSIGSIDLWLAGVVLQLMDHCWGHWWITSAKASTLKGVWCALLVKFWMSEYWRLGAESSWSSPSQPLGSSSSSSLVLSEA